MTSLSGFFRQADPATLIDCDREQIHFAGAILEEGVVLVLDASGANVIAASANAADALKVDPNGFFNRSLAQIHPQIAYAIVETLPFTPSRHVMLDVDIELDGIPYDCIAHQHDKRIFIECIKSVPQSMSTLRKQFRNTSAACADILGSDSWKQALEIAVREVRALTGYKRVKIYQFLPDWSGEVIAEHRDEGVPSFLGLRFPATDIPQQARALYQLTPARAVGNVHDRNVPLVSQSETVGEIDLTYSLLRATSPLHTQYLRNMGIEATFSMRLLDGDALWGLIACHNDEPGIVPFDCWGLVHEVSVALMARKERVTRLESAEKLIELRGLENEFARNSRDKLDLETMISGIAPALQAFMNADGFAFQYGGSLVTAGVTPPDDFIRDLVVWASTASGRADQLETTELHALWPPAKAHMDTACGVLIQPVFVHRVCQLIWFRRPVSETVEWAGKPVQKTNAVALTPRGSFQKWTEENVGHSSHWRRSEIESAREILRELLDMVAAQVLLRKENEDLYSFASKAAHDIKVPLRGIRMALSFIREDFVAADIDADADDVLDNLEVANDSAETLDALTDGLLELMVLKNQAPVSDTIDLNDAVDSAKLLLSVEIGNASAQIHVDPLPKVQGEKSLLVRVFLNLIGNALKYRSDRDIDIRISAEQRDDHVEISVSDNGTGIPSQYAERIFAPLTRLVAAGEIAGSGLGLSICKRIMEAMGGAIWLDTNYTGGARFILRFASALPEDT